MKKIFILFLGVMIQSCSTPQPTFVKEKTCSKKALDYISRNQKSKKYLLTQTMSHELMKGHLTMQGCYEAYKTRTGKDEFNTCLVVGVNHKGKTEFFNFDSAEVPLDREFMECAHRVTKSLQYGKFGKNYMMVQSYQFYYQ